MFCFRNTALLLISVGLVACGSDDPTPASSSIIPPVVMSDTGVTTCADQLNQDLPCPVATHVGQDGDKGRDFTVNDNSDGSAGFDFTKLDSNGQVLGASAPSWDCVLDDVTGLIWEVKTKAIEATTDNEMLRLNTNTFTWYNSSRSTASGDVGVANGGSCVVASSCDTEAYVTAVNTAKLCGFTDWRLPSRAELLSIVDFSQNEPGPMLDADYFPNVLNPDQINGLHTDWYWSSQTAAGYARYGWTVNFNFGGTAQTNKNSVQHVRLVRGG